MQVAEGEDGEEVEEEGAVEEELFGEGRGEREGRVEMCGWWGGQEGEDGEDGIDEADFFVWDETQHRWEGEGREG